MFIPPHLFAQAEILRAEFPRSSEGEPSDDTLADVVTWLIETFTIKRSLELALAIGRQIGAEHCIRVVRDDGSTSFALIAKEPQQAGLEAEAQGVTIFGRVAIPEWVRGLSGEASPLLQVGIANSERLAGTQDEALLGLASLFPWYRDVLSLSTRPIDTPAVIDICAQLGMPGAFLKKPV